MSNLEQIKIEIKIAATTAELAAAKRKLAEAEGAGNEAEVAEYEDQVASIEKLLTLQLETKNLLIKASLGVVIKTRVALEEYVRMRASDGRQPAMGPDKLADFGGMADQEDKAFGRTLYGVDHVSRAVAVAGQTLFSNFEAALLGRGLAVKERFPVTALLSGLGTGKSTFLDKHLEVLQTHCTDPALLRLLQNNPLVLSVTFNSYCPYTAAERSDSGELALARRIVMSYFGLEFDRDLRVELGTAMKTVLHHFKARCGLDSSAKVCVILNVDELNSIDVALDGAEAKRAVREVVMSVRNLTMDGVQGSPVVPLLASTVRFGFYQALQGSGIYSVVATLPTLRSDEVMSALRKCSVPQQYLDDPDFLHLLDASGGVPRIVRKMLEGITMQYDKERIAAARQNAAEYLLSKMTEPLNEEEFTQLAHCILCGEPVSGENRIVPTSPLTYDALQTAGMLWLSLPADNCRFYVTMPLLSLEMMCDTHAKTDIAIAAMSMLKSIAQRDGSSFEVFSAQFHAFKMRRAALSGATTTLEAFYGGVEMHPTVAAIEIDCSGDKRYGVHHGSFTFPKKAPQVSAASATPATATRRKPDARAAEAVKLLSAGKVFVNGRGAPVDAVMIDKQSSGKVLVRALCIADTVDSATLDLGTVESDRKAALDAFRSCVPYTRAKVVTVHITNREVAAEAERKHPQSIIIGRDNLGKFFGPELERGLWSATHLAGRFPAKPGPPGARGYCTGGFRDAASMGKRFLLALRLVR